MTTVYGGVKRCRAKAVGARGWCRRHEHWQGDNSWRVPGEDDDDDDEEKPQGDG